MQLKSLSMFLVVLVFTTNIESADQNFKRTPGEQRVLATIKRLREYVLFDKKKPGKSAIFVTFSRRRHVTNADLTDFKSLTTLEKLYLNNTEVTDTCLIHLNKLTNLKILHLYDCKITGAGLIHLKNLVSLDLHKTKVGDSGLFHLKHLSKLLILYLGQTQVTNIRAGPPERTDQNRRVGSDRYTDQ